MPIKHFMNGGYTVIKEPNYLLAFDHGDLGYLSIAAHGHADALSIWLHVDGQPVIVDAGTYTYNGGRKWRDYFRSTAAHNTLTINGESSSIITGAFNWGEKARCRVESYEDGENWHIEASHDGYMKRFGATHIRRVEKVENGIRIVDMLSFPPPLGGRVREGVKKMIKNISALFFKKFSTKSVVNKEKMSPNNHPHPVPPPSRGRDIKGVCLVGKQNIEITPSIAFLIHPDLEVVQEEGGVRIMQGERGVLRIENTAKCRLVRGEENPIGGWYSPSFGKKIPATQVVFYGQMEFETVLRVE